MSRPEQFQGFRRGLQATAAMAALAACNGEPRVPLPALPAHANLVRVAAEQRQLPRQDSPASCNIETVGEAVFAGQPVEASRSQLTFNGWLLPERSRRPASAAALRFIATSDGGAWQLPISRWTPRPDVLAAMKVGQAGDVGFRMDLDAGLLKPGSYRVVVVFDDGDVAAICDKNATVVLR